MSEEKSLSPKSDFSSSEEADTRKVTRRITIDPITRLEGHGKIDIFLDERGDVERAYFQIPELRGFEKFAVGRPAEDMPQITSRICGVCPTAHHMASIKTLDEVYRVVPPPAAKIIRELVYNAFMMEDHALHFYYLGGPDFVVGPKAPAAERNILGVIAKVGSENAQKVIAMRRKLREIISTVGGKAIHPVFGLPGGVARGVTPDEQTRFSKIASEAIEFGKFSLELFDNLVLKDDALVELILSETYTNRTHYMGIVDENNHLNFCDGSIRVVSPSGEERAKFTSSQYLEYIAEHVEPWTYVKFAYFKPVGWQGFVEGDSSGIYCVAPLARLNVADGMATPVAQEAYEKYIDTLGGKPVHHTLANHWARIIELVFAAERMKQLADDPEITDPNVQTLPTEIPTEGVGIIEAPRGTLVHHYQTDEYGIIQRANLIVATQNNSARMAMTIEKAAKEFISGGEVSDGVLNLVEMAFRAYDPCHGCATHSLTQTIPLQLTVRDTQGEILTVLCRNQDGRICRE